MMLLAILLSAAAAGLLVPAPRTAVRAPDRDGSVRPRPYPGRPLAVGLAGASTALLVTVDGLRLVLALIVLGGVAGAVELAQRARLARAADRRRSVVVEVCEALVGELRAGQPLVSGLEHCSAMWPDFEPVAAAGRLGADVPAALRRLGGLPGAAGLREVAAAWQVAERSGAGLATALSQVAQTARAREGTRQLVQGELASAQATARLVALLPVASLAMSAGIGGDPWHFLFGTAVGLACLALGAVFVFAGLLWIDRIAASVLRG